LATIFFALIPFAAVCFSVQLWDRVHPILLGLPFNLFWLLSWTVLTPICLGIAYYRMKSANPPGSASDPEEPRA
jgi:hypothetical protein